MRRRRIAVLFLFALLSGACGKKGPPLPPVPHYPLLDGPPPAARQNGDDLQVRVLLPTIAADGAPLETLTGLRLYRIERPAPSTGMPVFTPRDFDIGLEPVLSVEGAAARELQPGAPFVHSEQLPPPDAGQPLARAFAFRFRGAGRRWSPLSSPAVVVPGPASVPPEEFEVASDPGGVRLTWAGVETPVAVFRGPVPGEIDFRPLAVLEPGRPVWIDDTAQLGQSYDYQLRAVTGDPAGFAYGPATAPVRLAVEDVFPPAAPRGLAALAGIGGVDLVWQPGDEADLAGYHVWRRELPAGDWERLTVAPVQRTSWFDEAAVPERRYAYAVSAVDGAQPANESPRSESDSVQVPAPPAGRTP